MKKGGNWSLGYPTFSEEQHYHDKSTHRFHNQRRVKRSSI